MGIIVDIVSWAALLAGGFFYAVGAIGLWRMPDVYTRMHSISVSETLGTGFLILGMVLQAGFTLITVKLLIIFLVLMVVSPVSSHALARAALHDGHRPLLANQKGWLVRTNPIEQFPELGVRLREALSSEQVEEAGKRSGRGTTHPSGFDYAIEGDAAVAREGREG